MLRRPTDAAACVIALTLITNPSLAFGQIELEDWEEAELRPLMQRLGEAFQGDVPVEDPFEIAMDFMKGVESTIYVPFTLTVDPLKISMSQLALYLFVTPHLEPSEASDGGRGGDPLENELFENAIWEDFFFVDVSDSVSAGGPIEIHRAFQAPGGTYDLYVVVRDSVGEDGDEDDLADSMIMMLKAEVEVPDFWNGELQTSTVVLAQELDLIDAPLSPEDQRDNPYTIGTTRIVPKRDRDFGKNDNLSLLFWVYNPQLTGELNPDGTGTKTPDVTVEFEFHRQTPEGESFFNRTNPQEFNAQTWPAGQDVSGGIPSGQSVPLGSFPAGDFRLEIEITDNTAGQTLTREVNFTVSE